MRGLESWRRQYKESLMELLEEEGGEEGVPPVNEEMIYVVMKL